ncbi:MAG: phosphoenolpyruvate synthase [Alphaproteobacteria bacterium]|nr:phosphoenolpyruvate synthase [Alphaproteobacteria bacterium]
MSAPIIARAVADPPLALYGGKAVGLCRLQALGFRVPPWFVVTPRAFERSAQPGQAPAYVAPSPEVADEIAAELARLFPPDAKLAVRSSAAEEDALGHSFAGQFASYLNVAPRDAATRVADVWHSAFTPELETYRKHHGLTHANVPAVIVQRMVDAEAAGVAFTADPVTGATDRTIVNAVRGLADRLVAGETLGDTYVLDRAGASIERTLAGDKPVLSDAMLKQVADAAARIAEAERCPQDIEWAVEGGQLHLLQARPITTLAIGGTERVLWDNSNIVESYSGITTPLTFSFAARAYEAVYRELAMVLGVSRTRLDEQGAVFRNMIGLIRGRIYYNLLNWYRALALLPGFQMNRRFMEQMMGVDRALPRHLIETVVGDGKMSPLAHIADGARLVTTAASLIWKRLFLARSIRAFQARVNAALTGLDDLSRASYQDLAMDYRRIEAKLLRAWTPPLVNDLWCMIAFGVAKGLTRKWAGDESGALLNAVLTDQGGIVSAEPPRLIAEMGDKLRSDKALLARIESATIGEAIDALHQDRVLGPLYRAYIERFGDRCLGELKLESATLTDDPRPLWTAILSAARRPTPPPKTTKNAMEKVEEGVGQHRFRLAILKFALNEAKARVRDRENMRFERTRVFGRARRLFLEMAKRLVAARVIPNRDDVFYLTVEELLALAESSATAASLPAIAAARRAEFETYKAQGDLPRRFETVGAPALRPIIPVKSESPADEDPTLRRGLGCSAGTIRGRARVIRDPHGATLDHGDILIAEFTDPGWITVFANCAGLAVERGSLLSHSAIVARELGLPAVVGVPDLLAWINDGDVVEIDGTAGTIRKLPANVVLAKPKAAE